MVVLGADVCNLGTGKGEVEEHCCADEFAEEGDEVCRQVSIGLNVLAIREKAYAL